MSKTKKVCIAFLGNFYYDSRCYNLFDSLQKENFEIKVIAFDWLSEKIENTNDSISVFKLKKKSSVLFYLKFIFHLKFFLLRNKADIYIAEDVYCLPFVVIFGKWRKAKIIYDAREVYAHLAGLSKKQFIQNIIAFIEKLFIKKVDLVLTTGELDKNFLEDTYSIDNVLLLRNLPLYNKPTKQIDLYKILGIEKHEKIILYQGVILHGRGLKIIFNLLPKLKNCHLVILGNGDHRDFYINLANELKISNKVHFLGRIKQDELINYTASARVGLALIENISLSYYYALPNKLFEYIMAEVPVIVSNLPQMKEIVEKYSVGIVCEIENEPKMIESINQLLEDDTYYNKLKMNCVIASKELNWENEVKPLLTRLKVLNNGK